MNPEEIVFEHWNKKSPIKHRKISDGMKKNIIQKLKEYELNDLLECINNYSTVVTDPDSWYTYKSALDDFFRPGKMKPAPCMKFMPERFVESNFIRRKKSGVTW